MTAMLRVVLGEDDVLLREGMARLLGEAGLDVVARAADADDFLRKALAHRPDIARTRPDAALVDIGLPDGDGVVLATEFSGLAWRPRVVLTSSDADAVDDIAVKRAGALGFIAKDRLADGSLRRLLTGAVAT